MKAFGVVRSRAWMIQLEALEAPKPSTPSSIFSTRRQKVVGSMVSPIPGYGVDIIEWDVEVSPGWHELINGTVEQVYDQVLDIKPDWNPLDVPAAAAAPGKRGYKVKRGNVICGVWASATRGAIINGISYLRRVRGSATSGPGPGNCGRVSCSRNAAIWWCNDNQHDYTLESFSRIADSARLSTAAPPKWPLQLFRARTSRAATGPQ
ncbi:hypothetical protein G6O67_006755 [Ophiocordyceps sinensis]|uniref:Uncharacterized protein n=1 Tax=Ophiocordyceps sinensis TaxID=72228 RepID=A0A8H4LW71_9HYPO|nr:hypothetical protein G6O67_006755 [Ophiocordyceps sinensis]